VVGATAQRVRSLANDFPDARIAVLAESVAHVRGFERSGIDFFIDCNPGMDRTGHDPSRPQSIVALARAIQAAECEYRGLHWYDGHLASYPLAERDPPAHAGYDALAQLVETLDAATVRTREVIVAGTPAAPSALSYRWGNVHADVQISPGTVVYNDFTSLEQLPAEWGLQPAALVLTSVISHPRAGRITCDAGHKSVSADAGVPTCVVLGHPDWAPTKPSEEHLPIDIPGAIAPAIGETLLLLPRHICTTVNNFDEALLVRHGMIERAVPVTARGREGLRV
jgi:D-serine deaminase-like pyridoxal phosphate-dependent protein